jgi:hypothetical protein
LPRHGGDARDVGAGVGTVAGRRAGTRRAPRRVRRSEQPGGPIWLAAECVRPGQAGERLRHGLWVTELLRGGEALDMPGARAGRVAALLGDEAELGQ